jgi:hypothetical protein
MKGSTLGRLCSLPLPITSIQGGKACVELLLLFAIKSELPYLSKATFTYLPHLAFSEPRSRLVPLLRDISFDPHIIPVRLEWSYLLLWTQKQIPRNIKSVCIM